MREVAWLISDSSGGVSPCIVFAVNDVDAKNFLWEDAAWATLEEYVDWGKVSAARAEEYDCLSAALAVGVTVRQADADKSLRVQLEARIQELETQQDELVAEKETFYRKLQDEQTRSYYLAYQGAQAAIKKLEGQLSGARYWSAFWHNSSMVHEKFWRETESLRQIEGAEAAKRIHELETLLAVAGTELVIAINDASALRAERDVALQELDTAQAEIAYEKELVAIESRERTKQPHSEYVHAIASLLDIAEKFPREASSDAKEIALSLWVECDLLREDLIMMLRREDVSVEAIADLHDMTPAAVEYCIAHYVAGEACDIPEDLEGI